MVLTAPDIGTDPATNRTRENRGSFEFLEAFAGDLPGGSNDTRSAIDFSFLKFDLSGIVGQVQPLELEVHATSVVASGLVSVFRVPDDDWTEGIGNGSQNPSLDPTTGITGQNFGIPFLANLNKPADRLATVAQPVLGTVVFDLSGADLSADIANGFLTLAIALDDVPSFRSTPSRMRFYSKEGAIAPLLRVQVVPEPTSIAVMVILVASTLLSRVQIVR
ncbi:MAG: hypothetical protein AAGA92_15410 [Planctomycetota bacterium]